MKRIVETPAKIWGGKVLDIGGRDQVFVRGAGVERVLHTVRIAAMAHAGASGIIVEEDTSLGRLGAVFRADLEGDSRLLATLTLLFKGVDLEGVFWRPRGVGATALVGEWPAGDALVGVDWTDLERVGVPGAEPLAERLTPAELAERDLSRYA